MKNALSLLALSWFLGLTACGPTEPLGVCFRYETREDGVRVEDTVLWKECEPNHEQCCAETGFSRECVEMEEAVTEGECYAG
jgi:hypothetical protein